jgi:hypothetical protein
MATFFNPFVRARPAVTEGELNLFVRCLQRREIYPLPFNGARGGHVFHFSPLLFEFYSAALLLSFDGQGRPRQGAREPSARTGPDANIILPQDRYAARGLCAAMDDVEEDPM